MTEAQIKHMVSRFLGWKLPENFRPDAGISFKPEFNEHTPHPMKHEPSGTNLFDATQAEAMVRHMLEGAPETAASKVDIASDDRTANNAVRHQCRVLSDEEKDQVVAIKDKGAELLTLIEGLGGGRELAIARTKTEEAVMWTVKHITA